VSRAGCRLESQRPLQAGTSALLAVQVGGRLRCDDVRVARCEHRPGAGESFHLGAELLPTRRLTARTVRMAVHAFIDGVRDERGAGRDAESPHRDIEVRRDDRDKATGRAPPLAVVTEGEPQG